MTPATSPSVMSVTDAPVLRTAAIRSAWRGRSRTSAVMPAGFTFLALARLAMFSSAGADGDLVHVDVGRIEQGAAVGECHGRDRARHVLGAQRRAFERVDRDVH